MEANARHLMPPRGGVPTPRGVRWARHAAREAGDARKDRSGAAPATVSSETGAERDAGHWSRRDREARPPSVAPSREAGRAAGHPRREDRGGS